VRETFSVAGNMLAGEAVIDATAQTYADGKDTPFARRLLAAMLAGEAEGGDKRGKQGAALLVYDNEEHPLIDIRVDDHADPLPELVRLEAIHRERYVHYRRYSPTRANPSGLLDRDALEDAIKRSIAEGYE